MMSIYNVMPNNKHNLPDTQVNAIEQRYIECAVSAPFAQAVFQGDPFCPVFTGATCKN